MRKKFKRILISIVILLVIFIAFAILYNKFYGSIKSGSDIKISGPLSINYIDGSKLFIKTKKEINISVINSGEEDIYYYIEFVNVKNIKREVEYTLKCDNGLEINDFLNNYNSIISSYIKISPGEEQYYTITFDSNKFLLYSLDINIETEVKDTNYFSELLLKNNDVQNASKTVVGKEIATSDEGLIKTADDYGTAYYFRGNVQNNNVIINNHKFKVVRINGDGTVKLISDEITNEVRSYYAEITNVEYNNSNINTYLKSWLKDTLGKYEVLVANQKYCNDNTKKAGAYLAYNRLAIDYIPSLICLGDKISSKAALLTADEAVYAGAVINQENTSYYLYNPNIESTYYLMTAGKIEGELFYPFTINSSGTLNILDAGNNVRNIRPVITINKSATATGMGTVENPYILTLE